MKRYRTESDSMGQVRIAADKLWGPETQRALEHFSIGRDPMPEEMIGAYAYIKKACAEVNFRSGYLAAEQKDMIVTVCDELLRGQHAGMFPLNVWMSGSGTQFNMNVNEVIANRCSQIAGQPLGSRRPLHPNDQVNMSQSTNDGFPTAMCIAAALATRDRLLPSLNALWESLRKKSEEWDSIIKIGRTHLQDATPITFGQELSGYMGLLDENRARIERALTDLYRLAIGGTVVGTGLNADPGFGEAVAGEIAGYTGIPFVSAPNKFSVQGSHDALVGLSAAARTMAVSLFKISNDIRFLACGPRAGIGEILLPANEPGSSMMPGKVNPTQCEVLSMISVQVMANDLAVTMGGAGGYLEMNTYKPLLIYNILHSITLLSDGMQSFARFAVEGMDVDTRKTAWYVEHSLMQVTALSPLIGYDRASEVAKYAFNHDVSLRNAALALGVITAEEFDRVVVPSRMVHPGRLI
jgi:fumarate hydratase, class II